MESFQRLETGDAFRTDVQTPARMAYVSEAHFARAAVGGTVAVGAGQGIEPIVGVISVAITGRVREFIELPWSRHRILRRGDRLAGHSRGGRLACYCANLSCQPLTRHFARHGGSSSVESSTRAPGMPRSLSHQATRRRAPRDVRPGFTAWARRRTGLGSHSAQRRSPENDRSSRRRVYLERRRHRLEPADVGAPGISRSLNACPCRTSCPTPASRRPATRQPEL